MDILMTIVHFLSHFPRLSKKKDLINKIRKLVLIHQLNSNQILKYKMIIWSHLNFKIALLRIVGFLLSLKNSHLSLSVARFGYGSIVQRSLGFPGETVKCCIGYRKIDWIAMRILYFLYYSPCLLARVFLLFHELPFPQPNWGCVQIRRVISLNKMFFCSKYWCH